MRKSSLAVLPSSSIRRFGSPRPGTWIRMRSTPWRWITGSTVPSSSMRRVTIWIDCSTAWRTRSMIAGSVQVRRTRPPPTLLISTRALAGGAEQPAERLRQFPQLGQALLQIAVANADFDAARRASPAPGSARPCASRSTLRTSSRSCSTFSLRTAAVSTSSRRCEPPCRSSPSTTWRCAHFGQLLDGARRQQVRNTRTGR